MLKTDGAVIPQFLMNDKSPYKNPHVGEGAVFYTSTEVSEMITNSKFLIERTFRSWHDGESYWNHYLLRKPRSGVDRLRRLLPRKKEKKSTAAPIIVDRYPMVHGKPLREKSSYE